jgi:hypothetical protein
MENRLYDLVGRGYAGAIGFRAGGRLAGLALGLRNEAAAGRGDPLFPDARAYLADLSRRTVCLTLLAGSGSRWVKSLAAAAALPEAERPAWYDPAFDTERPRGLYRVRDFLGLAPRASEGAGGARIPVASYSLEAVKGFGRHLIVVRGWEDEIDAEVLFPLGIGRAMRDFFTQDAPFGKPLGHGDAAWQCRGSWKGADYVVTNFGGDANSRLTIGTGLLVLDALNYAAGVSPKDMRGFADLLIPAAPVGYASYPIGIDAEGLPRSFGHAKLEGVADGHAKPEGSAGTARETGSLTNVGLRVYRAPALLGAVEGFRSRFWVDGEGYAIPGNDPAGHEFALDNVDKAFAEAGRARLLAAARSRELTPAKSLDDIPAFEAAMAEVVAEDGEFPL